MSGRARRVAVLAACIVVAFFVDAASGESRSSRKQTSRDAQQPASRTMTAKSSTNVRRVVASEGDRSHGTASVRSMGPLRRLRSNPRYFTVNGRTAVYLTGSHTWTNLVDGSASDPPAAFDFPAYLADLERWHHNFMRLWAWDVTFDTNRGEPYYYSPQPYVRSGPGAAFDGKPRFDLSRLNQAYFDRLRSRVVQARRAGIYVAVMLFEGYTPDKGPLPAAYQGHPFAAENNVNGVDGDVNDDGRLHETYMLPGQGGSQRIWEIQMEYVRKVVDTVNDLDNVLYEIANEAPHSTTEWQHQLIEYIRRYQSRKPKQHPVGMTFQFVDGRNETLLASKADWVSPKTSLVNPSPAGGAKVVISDSDHHCGVCPAANREWVWKEFTRGRNPIFMDRYRDPFGSPNTTAETEAGTRFATGQTRRIANRINLAAMKPRPALASTRFVLADPGRAYVVYQPRRGPFTLDLVRYADATFMVEWIGVSSTSRTRERISGGRDVTLTPPPSSATDAAAYVLVDD